MTIWKLTDDVWWSNHTCLCDKLPPEVRAVLGAGRNIADLAPENSPANIPEKVPYFSICWPDHERVDHNYFRLLVETIELIVRHGRLPLLVHCRAGQQRAPTVAVLAASIIATGRPVISERLLQEAKRLRPDILTKPFYQSILERAGVI